MGFGFGAGRVRLRRRSRPLASPFPVIAGWEVDAGRWSYAAATGWSQLGANAARTYNDGNGAAGYLIEGAETFHSAPWHDSAAPHLSTSDAYLSKSVAADTIAYAGSHSQADIHGGTGKAVELTQGATANGIFTAANLKAAATSTADFLRCEMLFSIPVTTGVGGTLALRNSQNRAVVVNHDANGDITGWNATPNNGVYRAGYAQAGLKSDGAKLWFVWFECKATAAANVSPAVGLPTAIAGRKVVIHDLRIVLNPQTAPSAVPVLATNKTFAADTLLTGRTDTIGVLFHRLARCRTRITDGRLSIATTWARSGPPLPYETNIEIVASSEVSDAPGILPNEWQDTDFTPWLTPANFTLVLGPGYYNQRVGTGLGTGCVNMTITSAFKNNPLLMAQLERVKTSKTYLTGSMTLDDMVLFSRADEFTTQFEQVDLGSGANSLNIFDIGGSLYARRCLFVSHPSTHSRARGEAQDGDTDNQRVYMGPNSLSTTGGAGVVCDMSNSHFWRLGRSMVFTATTTPALLTINVDDCFHDQIWSDALLFGNGTLTISLNRTLFGRFTAAESSLYQSRKQIEVNTGSGWQDLSASGLTVANLPMGKRARHWGTWNFTTGTMTEAPIAGRTLIVRAWKRGSNTVFDKPGYQWNASLADHGDDKRLCASGDVYVIEQEGGPSPANPWMRLTFDLGAYTNSTTYVTSSTNPAVAGTGTHADACQVNRTTSIVASLTGQDVVLMGHAQGPFLTGNTGLTAIDSDIISVSFDRWIMLIQTTWALAFEWSKTPGSLCNVSNSLILPTATRDRAAGGNVGNPCAMRASGPNNTLALNNVWIGYPATSPISAASGATVIGAPSQVDVGSVSNYVISPPNLAPDVSDFLDPQWYSPTMWRVADDIDPLDTRFGFTASAESTTGIGLNAIMNAARGTHSRWDALKARIAGYHRKPNFVVPVSPSTPVGTVLLSGLPSKGWRRLWSGNEKGYFEIAGGELRVAKPLTGINQCWLLQSDDDKTFLIDIQ